MASKSESGSSGHVTKRSFDTKSDVKEIMLDRADDSDDESDGVTEIEAEFDAVDMFAPQQEKVQTYDYSAIQNAGVEVINLDESVNKRKKLASVWKHLVRFFHEDRVADTTDEQGNVELPMPKCPQAIEDHNSGLVAASKLFHRAFVENSAQHTLSSDDLEFIRMVKKCRRKYKASQREEWQDDQSEDSTKAEAEDAKSDAGSSTNVSQPGSTPSELARRHKKELNETRSGQGNSSSLTASEDDSSEDKEKLKMLNLCGLVTSPKLANLTEEERQQLQQLRQQLAPDSTDAAAGADEERFPCSCCNSDSQEQPRSSQAAAYYDLLFARRKNSSFSVRFDMVHCLPRFVLHYRFSKQLLDCLSQEERLHLLEAAADFCISYNLEFCTLQIPFGKYRTNAYNSMFAYLLVADHARYVEIFEVANHVPRPQEAGGAGRSKSKPRCIVPNWPDRSYMTPYWTYSTQSDRPSDKDPTLTTNLYQLNVMKKATEFTPPEMLVTRRLAPKNLRANPVAARRRIERGRNDLGFFGDFALLLHHEQPMLGFGSASHPDHATAVRDSRPDTQFLLHLMNTMLKYIRERVSTAERLRAGRDDLACCVNVSMQHSYAFKGHQAVYGCITFPRTSTFWKKLDETRRRDAAVAEGEVTHRDIQRSLATESTLRSFTSSFVSESETLTNAPDDEVSEEQAAKEGNLTDKLPSCSIS